MNRLLVFDSREFIGLAFEKYQNSERKITIFQRDIDC